MKQTYSTPTQKTPDFIRQYPSPYLDLQRVANILYREIYGGVFSSWVSTIPETNIMYLLHGPRINTISQEEAAMLAEFTHFFLLEEYSKNPNWHQYCYSHMLA